MDWANLWPSSRVGHPAEPPTSGGTKVQAGAPVGTGRRLPNVIGARVQEAGTEGTNRRERRNGPSLGELAVAPQAGGALEFFGHSQVALG